MCIRDRLILGDGTSMEASTFIFYMVILYSIINPLKDFAKAGYNIPKGLASMELSLIHISLVNQDLSTKEYEVIVINDGL